MFKPNEVGALLAKLESGKCLLYGIPFFLQADGSILDNNGNQVAKA